MSAKRNPKLLVEPGGGRNDISRDYENEVVGWLRAVAAALENFELGTLTTAKGATALARLRAEGRDPAHGTTTATKRGDKIAAANRQRAAWD